jgi:hypothetical protein
MVDGRRGSEAWTNPPDFELEALGNARRKWGPEILRDRVGLFRFGTRNPEPLPKYGERLRRCGGTLARSLDSFRCLTRIVAAFSTT